MQRTTRFATIAAVAIAILSVALWSPTETKARGKKSSLRKEVAELRQELAALRASLAVVESRLEFEARQDAVPPTSPVGGICADPCAQDSDGDGTGDCEDLCPCDVENADTDGDGVPDCVDPCPDDPTNACIGPCPLLDQDGDGVRDCSDPCPFGSTQPCVSPAGEASTSGPTAQTGSAKRGK